MKKYFIKEIPYVYEIYPLIKKIHDENNHLIPFKLIDKIINSNYYFDSIDFIYENILKTCEECVSKYYNKKIKITNNISFKIFA